jgi:hypothetical protein
MSHHHWHGGLDALALLAGRAGEFREVFGQRDNALLDECRGSLDLGAQCRVGAPLRRGESAPLGPLRLARRAFDGVCGDGGVALLGCRERLGLGFWCRYRSRPKEWNPYVACPSL